MKQVGRNNHTFLNSKKMKAEKINFKNIKNVLSRDEMRMIMAGDESLPSCNEQTCFACVQTAADITCYHSNNYSQCVQNISSQCFSNFSISSTGCYC
jgi:hypothetical protein